MESMQWYLRRLRVMSLREIAYRSTEPARLSLLRLGMQRSARDARAADWKRFGFCTAERAQLPAPPCAFTPTAAERDRLLAGDFGALGFAWRWQPDAGVWRIAPDTGRAWPKVFFGSIAYRADNPYGDVRVLWEPARLQGLVSLALLARHDPACREPAATLAQQILQSFVGENPHLVGPHYISAMECALRLIAVCHALDLLRSAHLQPKTWAAAAGLVTSHATLISKRLSVHSSSGNHLIAECAGLVYAGVLFHEHPRAVAWRDTGLAILEQEAARQILGDGGGIEQALHYQLFIVDLLGLVVRLLENRSAPCPAPISEALRRGRAFLGALASAPEELPAIGDADDGAALTPHLRISFKPGPVRHAPFVTLADSGYTRCEPQDAAGLAVVIDHGPLGMAPACGHGHADALSVIVSVRGERFLIDAGTYGYNLGAKWREYFRSTAAHNTVTVDGLDQAVQAGTFLWTHPYTTRYVVAEQGAEQEICCLLMRHDGYRRVGVVHWRAVLIARHGILLVWDCLSGAGRHNFELHWHLGLEPSEIAAGARQLAFANGYRLEVSGGESSLHRGEHEPPRGWHSPRYGVRTAATNLCTRWEGAAPHEFTTVLRPAALAVDVEASVSRLRRLKACCPSA
jgi:hypothetical protein